MSTKVDYVSNEPVASGSAATPGVRSGFGAPSGSGTTSGTGVPSGTGFCSAVLNDLCNVGTVVDNRGLAVTITVVPIGSGRGSGDGCADPVLAELYRSE
jgi:hypothetical protein